MNLIENISKNITRCKFLSSQYLSDVEEFKVSELAKLFKLLNGRRINSEFINKTLLDSIPI